MGAAAITVHNALRVSADNHIYGKAMDSASPAILTGLIQLSTSYATGGDTLDLSKYYGNATNSLGNYGPDTIVVGPSTNGYTVKFTPGNSTANNTVQAYVGGNGTNTHAPLEVASTGNLTLEYAPFIAFGGQLLLQ